MSAVQEVMCTVDLVPLFRALGEKVFQAQVKQQRDAFRVTLGELPDFERIAEQFSCFGLSHPQVYCH